MKLLPDILAAAVIVGMAFFLARSPSPDLRAVPRAASSPAAVQERQPEERGSDLSRKDAAPRPDDSLKARNIFAANGAYAAGTEGVLPEANAYTLIGIAAQGKEKRAIFRDSKGVATSMIEGQKLADGARIARIENGFVLLQRGNEKTELKVFDVPNREKTILSRP